MNNISSDRVLQLVTQLNQQHLERLQRYAAFRSARHASFKQSCAHLFPPDDLVHSAIASVLPIDGGPTRSPNSDDLIDLDGFLLYLEQTIWSLISNHAKRHDQSKIIHSSDDTQTRDKAQLTPLPLAKWEAEDLRIHIEAQLWNWAGESKRRQRAVKRFMRVLNGGAIPKHGDFKEVQQVAREIYFEI